jgi:hypothetical protein
MMSTEDIKFAAQGRELHDQVWRAIHEYDEDVAREATGLINALMHGDITGEIHLPSGGTADIDDQATPQRQAHNPLRKFVLYRSGLGWHGDADSCPAGWRPKTHRGSAVPATIAASGDHARPRFLELSATRAPHGLGRTLPIPDPSY